MKHYPSMRYHPTKEARVVQNEQEDMALGHEWVHSPAEFGVETCPGRVLDPAIAAKRAEYEARVAAHRASLEKASTPKKVSKAKEGAKA